MSKRKYFSFEETWWLFWGMVVSGVILILNRIFAPGDEEWFRIIRGFFFTFLGMWISLGFCIASSQNEYDEEEERRARIEEAKRAKEIAENPMKVLYVSHPLFYNAEHALQDIDEFIKKAPTQRNSPHRIPPSEVPTWVKNSVSGGWLFYDRSYRPDYEDCLSEEDAFQFELVRDQHDAVENAHRARNCWNPNNPS